MKAKTGRALDRTTFEKMKRIMPTYLAAQRQSSETPRARKLPEEVAFKLTNQCNLRCSHCYQWNTDGHHHSLKATEQTQHLPFHIISDVFEATRELQSNVYLWGGEPLMYRHWNDLAALLERDPRWTSICTNGTFIEKRLDSLLRISSRLEVDIAVDGLESVHDSIRGQGVFRKVLRGIDQLLQKKRNGEFNGEITINCVITDNLAHNLVDVVRFWENLGVDTIYLGLPWYLSEAASASMDGYVEENLPWIDAAAAASAVRPSWHAYKYRITPDLTEPLLAQFDRINEESWKVKVRYNPALRSCDLRDFILGSGVPAAGKTRCLAILSRMDILPSGDVVSCKFFPESWVGNLKDQEVSSIWQGQRFQRLRETIDRCGLMPVCSKCSLLYSRGV